MLLKPTIATLWVLVGSVLLAAEPVDFARDVKPILQARCHRCHGPAKQKAGLRLDAAALVVSGGNSGAAIVPGKSAESLLIHAVLGRKDVHAMPPEGPRLSPVEISLIEQWINEGAPLPLDEKVESAHATQSNHWAFQPVKRTTPPDVTNAGWIRNPIDNFILARLEKDRIEPSREADPVTLIRRLSFDLLGLPPRPEEVEAFLADSHPEAYMHLVKRLLASPHHGERWGRHWLDLARYADSNGYTIDGSRSIWKYRDWVINAINSNLSFEKFTIDQIAGDMLPGATLEQVIATGFHRNTMRNEEGGTDQEQFRIEAVADRVNTTASVFLGLTVGCARCHDHKYDPISQREYYELFALLNNADEPTIEVPTTHKMRELPALANELALAEKLLADNEPSVANRQEKWEKDLATQVEKLKEVPESVRGVLATEAQTRTEEQKNTIAEYYRSIDPFRLPVAQRVADLKGRQKQLSSSITTSLVMAERQDPRKTYVHIRGDFLRPGAMVNGAVPAVLPPLRTTSDRANRLDFARWLVDARNPLTPRVTMNRIWQQYFSHGIVSTENDFGTQGTPPSHPELLDWLANEFVSSGWDLKHIHWLIVTSATYRQSSHAREDLKEVDPYNRLLARQTRIRLEAETIRDAGLAVSGLLSDEIGGPGVYPPQPEGIYRFTQNPKYWKTGEGGDRYRRGIYIYYWRSSPYPLLATFDTPDATTACTRRPRSNTPLQALTLANDPAFVEMAKSLALRVLGEALPSDMDRLKLAFRLCFARTPLDEEVRRLSDFLDTQRTQFAGTPSDADAAAPQPLPPSIRPAEGAAWTAVARVMLNLDELITRE